MSNYCVQRSDGAVACRGWVTYGTAYAKAYGWQIMFRQLPVRDMLIWETQGGALRFAAMNGGTVMLVADVLDRSVNTAAV